MAYLHCTVLSSVTLDNSFETLQKKKATLLLLDSHHISLTYYITTNLNSILNERETETTLRP